MEASIGNMKLNFINKVLEKAPEISQAKFFKIGLVCFIVITCAHIGGFILNVRFMNFFGVSGALAQIVFDFALIGFFYYLSKQFTEGGKGMDTASTEDINNLFEEAETNANNE